MISIIDQNNRDYDFCHNRAALLYRASLAQFVGFSIRKYWLSLLLLSLIQNKSPGVNPLPAVSTKQLDFGHRLRGGLGPDQAEGFTGIWSNLRVS